MKPYASWLNCVSKKVINNLLIYFQNKQNMNFNVLPKGSFNLGQIKEINK